jgi:polysaccharide biosynthesis/export protein
MKEEKKMTNQLFLAVTACIFILSSCYHNRTLVYLRDKEFSEKKPSFIENRKTHYQLQPFDIISIQIKSSAEEPLSNVFNVNSQLNSMFATPGNFFMEGYSVDVNGKITLPVIGELAVKDLTLEEVQKLIQLHVNRYLKSATVMVKLTSFKVTVLGEVKNSGYYYVYNNQATILEALGMAGDLTPTGNRKNIKLIRQKPEGSEVVLIDLTESDLLKSEYYFLQPGDVLYVEPLKVRASRANLELLGVVFSAITTAILILNYVATN